MTDSYSNLVAMVITVAQMGNDLSGSLITQFGAIVVATITFMGTVYSVRKVRSNETKTDRVDKIITEGASNPESVSTLLEVIEGLREELKDSNQRSADRDKRNLRRIRELEDRELEYVEEIHRLRDIVYRHERKLKVVDDRTK